MSRTLQLTVGPDEVPRLLQRLDGLDGIIAVIVHRGAVRQPAGDLVVLHATNQAAEQVARIAIELGLAEQGCIVMDKPVALVSRRHRREIEADTDEASWEEMDTLLRRDANSSHNFLGLMALSGAVAGVGLILDTLHIVIAAMLITPAFTPLVRITMGLAAGLGDTTRDAVQATLAGYLSLAAGGALGMLLADLADPRPGIDALTDREWIAYWSRTSWTGVIAAVLAGLAGGLVVNAHQTVFATGVMVALALVPAAAIVGMGVAAGEFGLAAQGLGRWTADTACVLAASGLVFGIKRGVFRRRAHS